MKTLIHIFGPSGAGTSTLGAYLCRSCGFSFFDADDYYWLPTDPPFQQKRDSRERFELLRRDLDAADRAVVSGSITVWGDALTPRITLAVRLETETALRLDRIRKREAARFGDRILPGGDLYDTHQAFLVWAGSYDDGGPETRSRRHFDLWQEKLSCPVLRLDGAAPLQDNAAAILAALE